MEIYQIVYSEYQVIALTLSAMAKLFSNGRSQAARRPKEFRINRGRDSEVGERSSAGACGAADWGARSGGVRKVLMAAGSLDKNLSEFVDEAVQAGSNCTRVGQRLVAS
jgi:hypothetical protein